METVEGRLLTFKGAWRPLSVLVVTLVRGQVGQLVLSRPPRSRGGGDQQSAAEHRQQANLRHTHRQGHDRSTGGHDTQTGRDHDRSGRGHDIGTGLAGQGHDKSTGGHDTPDRQDRGHDGSGGGQ